MAVFGALMVELYVTTFSLIAAPLLKKLILTIIKINKLKTPNWASKFNISLNGVPFIIFNNNCIEISGLIFQRLEIKT